MPNGYMCGEDACPGNGEGLWAKVLGRSGKIQLAPSPNVAGDPDGIRFEISALRELDSSGNVLGQGGSSKHSFNSFSTQDFIFGEVSDSVYGGVRCVKVPFSSILDTGSKIEIEVFLFKESGTIHAGPESFSVNKRYVKIERYVDHNIPWRLSSAAWLHSDTCPCMAGQDYEVQCEAV